MLDLAKGEGLHISSMRIAVITPVACSAGQQPPYSRYYRKVCRLHRNTRMAESKLQKISRDVGMIGQIDPMIVQGEGMSTLYTVVYT
jgi:hypothetical protein